MKRAVSKTVTAAALVAGSLWLGVGHADALVPAHPTPCNWTFGPLSSQGAAGTQVLEVPVQPANPVQSCIEAVALTGAITSSGGGVPAGITADGGTAVVTLLFTGGQMPAPTVLVAWHAYCTSVPQPVFLHLSGGGAAAVYPLGQSRPCSQGPGTTSAVDPPGVVAPDPAIGVAPATGGGYRVAVVGGNVLRQPGAVMEAGDFSATPFVGIAASPNGGFWLATSDGGVCSYSGAGFYGSAFGYRLAAPIVGIASTPTGHGYWLVAADGGVFSFGDALFHGSAGAARLVAPVVAMAADGSTGGYWLAAGDGGVFSYGAPFFGSAGAAHLAAPVTGMAATADSMGYWLTAGDGGIFTYGDAAFHGTAASLVSP